jgi:hypothetical protein
MSGYFDSNGIYRCDLNDGRYNHEVVVVGYNDTGKYWIAKNSWGTGWNENGYFKVYYGNCSITPYAYVLDAICDKTPPSPVTDLRFIKSTGTTATLEWTASGDNGTIGNAYYYKIAYSTEPITESNYGSMQKQIFYNSQPAGMRISTFVKDLLPETKYYFAIKAYDECLNPSSISNIVSGSTWKPRILLFKDNVEYGNPGWITSFLTKNISKPLGPPLWHITTHRSSSSSHSWYYGIENQWNYDTGSANNGSLISPLFDVSRYSDIYLMFNYSADLEQERKDKDYFAVKSWIDDTRSLEEIYSLNTSTKGEFIQKFLRLKYFIGTVQISFDFNSIDSFYNNYEGIYLDDIQLIADNYKPVANVGGPYSGEVGKPIIFDGSASYDPDGDLLTYNWDFGDGKYGEGKIVIHPYSIQGIYEVILTVSDGHVQSFIKTTANIIPTTTPCLPNRSPCTLGGTKCCSGSCIRRFCISGGGGGRNYLLETTEGLNNPFIIIAGLIVIVIIFAAIFSKVKITSKKRR